MAKLSFRRSGHGLYPSDDVTTEWLEEVRQNVDIVGDLRVPRNAKNHRHMFAILNEAAKNIDGFATVEDLLEYLKLQAGMYKVHGHGYVTDLKAMRKEIIKRDESNLPYETIDEMFDDIEKLAEDKRYRRPVQIITYESLKFESMDETRFKRVKARFLWILEDKFGFDPFDLEERALSQLAAYGAPDRRR